MRRRSQVLPKRELLRQYPTLCSFSETHLSDVSRMYSRAYGGPEHECGIEADGLSSSPPIARAAVTVTSPAPLSRVSARANPPQLSLETSCAAASCAAANGGADGDEEEQTTPTAASARDEATTNAPDSLAWTSFLNISPSDSPLLLPLLGATAKRRNRFRRTKEQDNGQADGDRFGEDDDGISDVLSETSTTVSSLPSLPSLSSSLLSVLSEEDDDDDSAPANTVRGRTKEELNAAVTAADDSTPSPVNVVQPTWIRPMAMSPAKLSASPRALLPVLTLQTTFSSKKPATATIAIVDSDGEETTSAAAEAAAKADAKADGKEDGEEEEEQLTARPVSSVRKNGGSIFFGTASIGEMLQQDAAGGADARSPADTLQEPLRLPRLSRASILLSPVVAGAPQPPKSYEDISPITRSEWGFLMGDQTARQVTVTTF